MVVTRQKKVRHQKFRLVEILQEIILTTYVPMFVTKIFVSRVAFVSSLHLYIPLFIYTLYRYY